MTDPITPDKKYLSKNSVPYSLTHPFRKRELLSSQFRSLPKPNANVEYVGISNTTKDIFFQGKKFVDNAEERNESIVF